MPTGSTSTTSTPRSPSGRPAGCAPDGLPAARFPPDAPPSPRQRERARTLFLRAGAGGLNTGGFREILTSRDNARARAIRRGRLLVSMFGCLDLWVRRRPWFARTPRPQTSTRSGSTTSSGARTTREGGTRSSSRGTPPRASTPGHSWRAASAPSSSTTSGGRPSSGEGSPPTPTRG
jgi:hypothetical protein